MPSIIRSDLFSVCVEENSLNSFQLSCSQVLQGFKEEACNPLTLLGLMGGGALARSIELGCFRSLSSLSISHSRFSLFVPKLASLAGVITEGGFFTALPMAQQGGSLSDWSIGTGHGSLVIGLSRVVSCYTHSSFLMSCLAQDCVVMGIDISFEKLHLRESQNLGLAERWIHARAVAFQMQVSGEICHFIPVSANHNAMFEIQKGMGKPSVTNRILSHQSDFNFFEFFADKSLVTTEGMLLSKNSLQKETEKTERLKREHLSAMSGITLQNGKPNSISLLPGRPILGSLLPLLKDFPGFLLQASKLKEGIVAVKVGPQTAYIAISPHYVHEVLFNKHCGKGGDIWEVVSDLLGYGLITSSGLQWETNRRIMQGRFTPKALDALAETMASAIHTECDHLERLIEKKPIRDLSEEMARFAQQTLLKTMFSTSLSGEKEAGIQSLSKDLQAALETMNPRLLLSFLPPTPRWILRKIMYRANQRFEKATQAINSVVEKIISDRHQETKEYSDLLSSLLKKNELNSEIFDDKQLRDELKTLLVAGIETTSSALTFAWYTFNKHPEIAAKVQEEIRTVLNGKSLPTAEDLRKLAYTKKVLMEIMRLYPPIFFYPRFVEENTQIGEHFIPKGSVILLTPYATHRLEEFWENPEEFNPERFTEEEVKNRPKHTYFPFGGGPRQCIGNHFAMMEIMLTIVIQMQRFQIELINKDEIRLAAATTLKSKTPLVVKVQRKTI